MSDLEQMAYFLGYAVMSIFGPLGIYWMLMWTLSKIPPINRKLTQIIILGTRAYMALPRDQRKGWKKGNE